MYFLFLVSSFFLITLCLIFNSCYLSWVFRSVFLHLIESSPLFFKYPLSHVLFYSFTSFVALNSFSWCFRFPRFTSCVCLKFALACWWVTLCFPSVVCALVGFMFFPVFCNHFFNCNEDSLRLRSLPMSLPRSSYYDISVLYIFTLPSC